MNIFKEVPKARVPHNRFDLSHEVKMSGKFGWLYPFLLVDTLPGETWNEQAIAFARFAPMLSPIMHRVILKTDFFFVPMRLCVGQSLWEEHITGGQNGTATPVLPYMTPFGIDGEFGGEYMEKGSLWDYFGLPLSPENAPAGGFSTQHISMAPFKAYAKIWNDYFRDPNLDTEIDLALDVEGDQSTNPLANLWLTMRLRGWDREMFTGALPWAQRGPEVLLPLSGTGSVTYSTNSNLYEGDGDKAAAGALSAFDVGLESRLQSAGAAGTALRVENIAGVTLDSSDITIIDFRTALAMQRWYENNARGGGRYIEQIESHYDERVPDYRLQRAEYLGGGRQVVRISEVLSTTDTATVPVGDMAGHGISVGKSNRFSYRCREHGYIIGILSIVPVPSYATQGIPKLWTRESRYDVGFPEFANLGEQAMLSKELFFSFDADDTAENDSVFGYVPRYTDYKFMQDRLAGDFRDTLAFWHLSRIFVARPVLDSEFLQMHEEGDTYDESYRRIFAVQDGTDYIWMQIQHNLTARRPLPYYGVPKILG